MRRSSIAAFAVLFGVGVLGCGGGGGGESTETAGKAGTETTAGATKTVDPATAATVTGKVMFSGTAPEMKKIKMGADPKCAAMHTDAVNEYSVVVNPDNSLKWVFVYVSKGLEGVSYPVPTEKKVLDQRTCMYEPHVWGMMAGQPLEIINSDETLHNVHAIPKDPGNQAFNLAMPFKDQKFEKTFAASEVMIPVKCEVHPWMHAFIGVLPHPVHAVSGDDGAFSLTPLPPGTYTVTAWHEVYGTQTQDVTVGPSETKDITFTFSAPATP